MKAKLPMIARILLGLIMFASGLAGLFNLIPPPPNMPEKLMTFMTGLMATTYFMPFLKLTETICGLALITGFFVPLSLVILAPIVIHIFFVHMFLAPEGLVLAVVMGLLMIYLSFFAEPYASKIKPLFTKK
jgi:uncharacterized membrane protein YphA (DoxX/SURF4 family)